MNAPCALCKEHRSEMHTLVVGEGSPATICGRCWDVIAAVVVRTMLALEHEKSQTMLRLLAQGGKVTA